MPVFNDEAIYLDWGWRETTTPGFLFYSLYDAKQPLLMWVFAVGEQLFQDPLLGGRMVSVICGLFSLIGLFLLGKMIWNKSVGLLSAFFYAISPLFLFYDRQALMESAVATIGIFSCIFLVKLHEKPYIRYGAWLGVLLGIGYFIKSSALVFACASFLIFMFFIFHEKQKKQLFLTTLTTFGIACIVVLPLLLEPVFWNTLPSNARFSLTLADYLKLPIQTWWHNIMVLLETSFFFLTPFVFVASIIGITTACKKPQKQTLPALWLLLTIGTQILVTRDSSVRYIVSFLPLLLLFTSAFYLKLSPKLKIPVIFLLVSIPVCMSLWQIFLPANYILSLRKLTSLAPIEYVVGQTSGYGISEIRQFINAHSNTPTTIGVAENAGNPESAMEIYYQENPHIIVAYLDKKMIGNALDMYDCIDLGENFYFISREEQQGGLNKFLTKVQTITNPYGGNTWGIYTLKPNCKGATANLNIQKK